MKKGLTVLLSLLLLAGCTSAPDTNTQVKNGEAKGESTADGQQTVVKVTLEDEKIKTINIDELGATSADGSKSGSKKDLGMDYGMKQFSEIGKEWSEQIQALENYIVTNGIDSIILEDEKPVNEDLKSSCTIKVSEYLDVAKQAVMNAK